MPPASPARLGIIGTGLIGASIGLAARAGGMHVAGADRSAERSAAALALGALDEVVPDLESLELDVLVVAIPVEQTERSIAGFRRRRPLARLILDVASVKAPIVAAAGDLAGFVATHPLAGAETSGPGAARADLFAGRPWAFVPGRDAASNERAAAFVAGLGATPVPVDAAAHDRIVALTSHLPQLLAVALAARVGECIDDPDVLRLAGPGLRSMTRLGGSSWSMWSGILAANAPSVAQEVRSVGATLSAFADALEAGDAARLGTTFAAAAAASERVAANVSG